MNRKESISVFLFPTIVVYFISLYIHSLTIVVYFYTIDCIVSHNGKILFQRNEIIKYCLYEGVNIKIRYLILSEVRTCYIQIYLISGSTEDEILIKNGRIRFREREEKNKFCCYQHVVRTLQGALEIISDEQRFFFQKINYYVLLYSVVLVIDWKMLYRAQNVHFPN